LDLEEKKSRYGKTFNNKKTIWCHRKTVGAISSGFGQILFNVRKEKKNSLTTFCKTNSKNIIE
jgi:hypothetical protein